ncbi:DUF4062 domain-containing protein [Pseudochryseolinea flava]|uniref:DUF4062 domain-containing protein n=1 Tax=Pseudochryseolinea flava TaxID=2059302 RepID=A0A364XZG2_9BACT|nr:DUF4062 domain-containing protein [Pseudochryseolinea flava]RAV99183.1 hypothetical protein DQQ10_19990 [Pseudochryseolinea flava]
MAFEIDVVIAFADRDNETASKNELGWVSQFKKFLELMLTQVLGEKPRIMLKGEFDSMVSPKMDNTAVLVSILSKDFIQSGQCLDHVETFYKVLESAPKNRNRVFKVFKTPLNLQQQPPRLRDLLGYEMYQLDPDSGEIREYTDYFSTEAERQYWMKMVDLAYDIYETLLFLRDTSSQSEVRSIYKRKTIYLAETGHDLSVQRNIIKRELQRHGYSVLPNQTLPGNASELERLVRRDLEECNLSIHLIGSAYGEIPEGADRSVVDLQNKFASEKSIKAKENKQEFTRLIWISPNMTHASERQKSFIDNIKRDVEAQEGAEILQTPLEDFKNIMREELLEAGEKKIIDSNTGRTIYLIHDKIDLVAIKPIVDLLEKSGFKVLLPSFEGELLALRQQHIDNLRSLDAAIIYKGKVNEQWVRMKALDLLKAPGFGRKKPIVAKAIVANTGSNLNVESFRSQNLRVIEGDEQRSIESLKSFLQEFNA